MHEPRACYTELSKSEGEKQIWYINAYIWNLGFPGGSDGKVSACSAGDPGLIPGLGRSPGEENGNPSSILAWEIPRTEEPGGL